MNTVKPRGAMAGTEHLSIVVRTANVMTSAAANRRLVYPQVKPPVPHDGVPDGAVLRLAELKVDICLRAPSLPHSGHCMSSSRSFSPLSFSNDCPHALHLYSYKGISQNLPVLSSVFFPLPPSRRKCHNEAEIRKSHRDCCRLRFPVEPNDHIFCIASHEFWQNPSPFLTLILCLFRPILGLTARRQSGLDSKPR